MPKVQLSSEVHRRNGPVNDDGLTLYCRYILAFFLASGFCEMLNQLARIVVTANIISRTQAVKQRGAFAVASDGALGDACCTAVNDVDASFQNCGGSRPVGLPFASRSPVMTKNGLVASAHPLASQAGLRILQAGGSAVDAAIATNAVLAVLEPMMNGPGGDLMAVVWFEANRTLTGYNGAGRASASWSFDNMTAELDRIGAGGFIPGVGPLTVTVPGAPRGWCDLSARFGKLPLATVLAPAIGYATAGAPVPPVIAFEWDTPSNNSAMTSGGLFPHASDAWQATFTLPDGNGGRRSPVAGDIFSNPDLAATLQEIADGGCDAFYNGSVAAKIVASAAINGLKVRPAIVFQRVVPFILCISMHAVTPTPACNPLAHVRRLRRAPRRVGSAGLDHISRCRSLRASSEPARHSSARDTEHPRGFFVAAGQLQLRGLPPRAY